VPEEASVSPFLLIPLAFVALVVWNNLEREHAYRRVHRLFAQGRPDEVLDYLDRWWVRLCFPTYNLTLLRLNAKLQKGDRKAAGTLMGDLLRSKCTKKQRADLLPRAFDFYLQNGKYKQAQVILDEITSTSTNPRFVAECQLTYDITAKADTSHIAEMEERAAHAEASERMRLLHLLAIQYENAHNPEMVERCHERMSALVEKSL
jgi:hypothetical protein